MIDDACEDERVERDHKLDDKKKKKENAGKLFKIKKIKSLRKVFICNSFSGCQMSVVRNDETYKKINCK